MIFNKDNFQYLPAPLEHSNVLGTRIHASDRFNPFDDGFAYRPELNTFSSDDFTKSKRTNARLVIADKEGNSTWWVQKGLTVILGEPGSGKTFFINNIVVPMGFPLHKWGEPESGINNQFFSNLLRSMNKVIASSNGSGVIDSIMPLIIIEDSNLGQGGLSKRILSYLRVLSSICWELNAHMIVAVNPLESGNIINLWANYIRGVVHNVVLIENRIPYISSRIEDPNFANVPPNREFGSGDRTIRRLLSASLPTSIQISLESLDSLNKSSNNSQSGLLGKSVSSVNPKFGEFPKL